MISKCDEKFVEQFLPKDEKSEFTDFVKIQAHLCQYMNNLRKDEKSEFTDLVKFKRIYVHNVYYLQIFQD